MVNQKIIKWSARIYSVFFSFLWLDWTFLDLKNITSEITAVHIITSLLMNGLMFCIPALLLARLGWKKEVNTT